MARPLLFLIFMCVDVCIFSAYYVLYVVHLNPLELVIDCDLPFRCSGSILGSLEQPVLLTVEPSSIAHLYFFFTFFL